MINNVASYDDGMYAAVDRAIVKNLDEVIQFGSKPTISLTFVR